MVKNIEQKSYRQILKATSLFGGVQIFNILIAIIRSKFIAILLGPSGMGIAGLLTSTTGVITSFTSIGIGTSALREISAANATNNSDKLATVIIVYKRLAWITGIIGTVITILMAPWLSEIAFGNKDYSMSFILISCTLLFTQLSNCRLGLLQGMRKLKLLAKTNILGSLIGLFLTIPLYYFYGLKGIVPGIIVSSIILLLLSFFYSYQIKLSKVNVPLNQTLFKGKGMLKLGLALSIGGILTLSSSYLIRIFISSKGGISDVGFYTAGFTIINTYVGIIFTAMGTDYYPRLASVCKNKELMADTITHQAEIAVLVIAPILVMFIIFSKLFVFLFYSDAFFPINTMIILAAGGMVFRSSSWSMGYVFSAKGDAKLLIINELITNSYFLILNIVGFLYFGLTGLGIAFLLTYFFHFIQMSIVCKNKYDFLFPGKYYKCFGIQVILVCCSLAIRLTSSPSYNYLFGILVIFISSLYSLSELNRKVGLNHLLKSFIKKT